MIKDYSLEELQTEIARRAAEEKEKAKPVPLENPDFSKLTKCCIELIDNLSTATIPALCSGYENHKQYIFEYAMQAIFGDKIFDWINKQF